MLEDDEDDDAFQMRSTNIAYMAISAARRSGLALLLGFWLALVVWAPSNGDLLVLQNRNFEAAVDAGDLRGTEPTLAGDVPQKSKALNPLEKILVDPDVVHLRRRALLPIEHDQDDPPERHRVEDQTTASQQDHRKDADRHGDNSHATATAPTTHRDRDQNDPRRIRDYLREQISTAKQLIHRSHNEADEHGGDAEESTTEEYRSREKPEQQNDVSAALDEVFISVKTTKTNHRTRLPPILQTWFQLARNQVGYCRLHDFTYVV